MAAPIKKEKELATKQRYLPDDITFQILHRLPVKSVLRYISVSKTWKSMIRTCDFVSAHHHHHHDHQEQTYMINYKMDQNRRSNLIYLTNDVSKRNQDCTLRTHKSTYSVFQLPLTGYTVIGECEGLICLTNSTTTYIWNPLVGILKKLPPNIYRNSVNYPVLPLILVSRFGFARRSRDYKVIRMICDDDKAAGVTNSEIYSLAADSWRKLTYSFPKFFRALMNSHVYFKGCIFCLSDERYDDRILKFDMEEESFMILKFVYTSTPIDNWEYKLVVIGKFLVALKVQVTVECGRKMHVSAYITEEPKSGQAWTTFEDILPIDYDGNMLRLMKITEGGEIVLEGTRNNRRMILFVYDSYCDGYRLEFKFRELGIFRHSYSSNLYSMKTGGTLSLLGERNI